jgi:hypothetical protein
MRPADSGPETGQFIPFIEHAYPESWQDGPSRRTCFFIMDKPVGIHRCNLEVLSPTIAPDSEARS